ncbi:MAG: YqgE/AlgH family protein [Gammaproteobacteria bacterium]
MIETLNVTDHFLIAMPGMGDPNFHRTVTYMCQHSREGALGIVINRPTDLTLGEILRQMEIPIEDEHMARIPVYHGGPVQPERGFVIHEPKGSWDSSLEVSDSIALTTSRDILEAIAKGRGPGRFVVALGYAGWGEGQLEREIVQNAWLNAPAMNQILFDTPAEQRWKSAARQMGIDIDRLSSSAGHG